MERDAHRDSGYGISSSASATAQHRRALTVDRGTMTTEVLYTPTWSSLPSSTATATAATAPPAWCHGAAAGGDDPIGTNAHIKELREKIHSLESKTAVQMQIIREKEANERLLEERAALHVEERRHLHAQLDRAVTPVKYNSAPDSSNIVRAVADTELSTILEAVIDVLRLFVESTDRLRFRLFQKTTTAETAVLPVVPCREYGSPHLNAIFSHLGGLRHVASLINELGENISSPPQQQHANSTPKAAAKRRELRMEPSASKQELPNTTRRTTSKREGDSTSTSHNVHHIGAWLAARKKHLEVQLQQATGSAIRPTPPRQSTTTTYQAGESLMDAAKELHNKSYRSPKQHNPL
ncbi:hypothetical protein DQ04_18301000 [Trypanosoma grayi]|uniref:hypothetical protein n=1 Tax=Trypanosoma grayi TaxID=71804 RepID=UPI0004F46208|nr:hypothetical protein DQ04_18301000 [Trypanosoma grayi]KEG05802.1 hypothetical protein DQ04_18301000 [Trypanosoma grayi]